MRAIILLLLFLASCAHPGPAKVKTSGTYLSFKPKVEGKKTQPITEQDMAKVHIFKEGTKPAKSFEVLGMVEAIGFGLEVKLEDLYLELKTQASYLGASGVYKIKSEKFNHDTEARSAIGIAIKTSTQSDVGSSEK